MDLIFVKLGGSLITDKSKPYTVRKKVLALLCKEIHEARKIRNFRLIVGHGGGSFPHTSAHKYDVQKGYINVDSKKGFSEVQNDAARLNRIVVQALIDAGENAVSVQPSASCIAEHDRIKDWYMEPIDRLLADNYVPVPFGDVVLDRKKGCSIASTEEIFRYLTSKLNPRRIVLVGKVNGVLRDVVNPDSMVEEINPRNFYQIRDLIKGSDATDVTGGMTQKVNEMLDLAKRGTESVIINGTVRGNLHRAILGERIGTRICK
jgi:isopentenyl phosphate kinase